MRVLFRNRSNYLNAIFTFAVIFLISAFTIGFAAYDELLSVEGRVRISKAGKVEVTNVTLLESNNVSNENTFSFNEQRINFNIEFTSTEESSYATYQIQLTNNSNIDYIFSGNDIEKELISSLTGDAALLNIEVEDLNTGYLIEANDSVVFTCRVEVLDSTSGAVYNANISSDLSFTLNDTGNIVATLNTSSVNLRGNNVGSVEIEVINTYSYSRDFYVSQTNSNLILNNGRNVKYTIPANSTQTYTVRLTPSPDAIFLTTSVTTSINVTPTYLSQISLGSINVLVDEYVEPDTEIPTVGNASINILDDEGQFIASWSRIDTEGSSIVNYNIKLYNSSNNLVQEVNTNSSSTSYTFTNISAGSYYFIVSGADEAGNNGLSYMSGASTSNGYATKSSTVALKWIFTVTNSLRGATSNGASTAQLNKPYSATYTANSSYTLPNSITVKMGSATLSSGSDYTYSSGRLTVNKVTGDLTITVTATRNTCLAEGTQILLADNTYKNIEDIRYDDLLKIYSYEEGRFINVYPIWIEKKNKASSYQINEFSDGTILKTVGFHGIYDTSKNMFVSVDDKDNYKVGSEIAMFDKDTNAIKKVKVTNIKNVNEEVNYYHVVSSRYYDIFANNLLTTDGTTVLSNLYGFNDNITWTELRKKVMSDSNNLYKYEEFSDIMPYYMFKGLRVEEGKILNNYGLDLNTFKGYLSSNQLNEELMLSPQVNKDNNRVWMVTTSDDDVINKSDYLLEEGSIYIAKEPKNKKNFISWYNTGTGEYVKPGDAIEIWYGTHLEAIYKS